MAAVPPKPPSVLLIGQPGDGKTFSIPTLVKAGIETFVVITEGTGQDSLLDGMIHHGADMSKLHIRHLSPATPGWGSLLEQARIANSMSYQAISELKSGIDKMQTQQYTALLQLFANFVDDRGESFGDVTEWGADRALVIDSMTGLNHIIMDQTVGMKPNPHQGEWGIAMNMEVKLLLKLTADCKCFFVVTSHLDKEIDGATGITSQTVLALGRKNAPQIIPMFSEVVLCKRNGTKYTWSTAEAIQITTKARGLPLSDSIKPDFAQLVSMYEKRKAAWDAVAKPSV